MSDVLDSIENIRERDKAFFNPDLLPDVEDYFDQAGRDRSGMLEYFDRAVEISQSIRKSLEAVQADAEMINNRLKKSSRQYTESELRAEFEKNCISVESLAMRSAKGDYMLLPIQNRWLGFLGCALFLGALSEAHKGETDK